MIKMKGKVHLLHRLIHSSQTRSLIHPKLLSVAYPCIILPFPLSSSYRRSFSTEKNEGEKITSIGQKGGVTEDTWAWIPPKSSTISDQSMKTTAQLAIKKRIPLTKEEVKQYLESNGAENVIILKLRPAPLGTISHFVIGTCSSTRLVRQFCVTIAKNLKDRELKWMIGYQGPEGAPDDDWQCVDCDDFAVHLFTEVGREVYDLESWWSMDQRPSLPDPNLPKEEYDRQWEELLEKYPPHGKSGRTATISYVSPEGEEAEEEELAEFEEIRRKYEAEQEAKQSNPTSSSSSSSSRERKQMSSKKKKRSANSNSRDQSSRRREHQEGRKHQNSVLVL